MPPTCPKSRGIRSSYPHIWRQLDENTVQSHIWFFPAQRESSLVKCPYCDNEKTRVIDTSHDARGGTRRRRVCDKCGERFSLLRAPHPGHADVGEKDGTREEVLADKLMAGHQGGSCQAAAAFAADIERIAGEVEAELQQSGKAEVSSHMAGDLVIKKLKDLDEVAYIRYATVYLGFDDLESIRKEIDRLPGKSLTAVGSAQTPFSQKTKHSYAFQNHAVENKIVR